MGKKYESVYIIKEDCDKKSVIENINKMIKEQGGNIYHKEEIGLKKLAYEVKGYKNGYFYLADFEVAESSKNIPKRLSTKINTVEEVLKHIVLKIEDKDEYNEL